MGVRVDSDGKAQQDGKCKLDGSEDGSNEVNCNEVGDDEVEKKDHKIFKSK